MEREVEVVVGARGVPRGFFAFSAPCGEGGWLPRPGVPRFAFDSRSIGFVRRSHTASVRLLTPESDLSAV